MAKLKNVTNAEIKAAEDACFEPAQVVSDLHRRASQGYADHIESPMQMAGAFLAMSRTYSEMAAWLIAKAGIQEQKRELEQKLKERA